MGNLFFVSSAPPRGFAPPAPEPRGCPPCTRCCAESISVVRTIFAIRNWIMEKYRKITLFKEAFRGRRDIVASYWKRSNGKCGYSPLRFRGNGKYRSFSDNLLQNHFKGKMILGVYPMTPDNTCYFIAADFDNHDGRKDPFRDVKAYYETCAMNNISCYLLRSKSGKGYHAYIFFKNAVSASKARLVAKVLLEEARLIGYDSSFDRLFPSQDRLSGKGIGNLISLPFQGRASKKGHTLFLNPAADFTRPFDKKGQANVLANLDKMDEPALDRLIDKWDRRGCIDRDIGSLVNQGGDKRVDHSGGRRPGNRAKEGPRAHGRHHASGAPDSNFDIVFNECRFIAHCKEDSAALPYLHWWAMISNVVRCRNGPRIVHDLSRPYPGYDRSETEYQIKHALDFPYPLSCKYIRNNITPRYCQECNYWNYIKNPAVLGIHLPRYSMEWISISHLENERDRIGCYPSEATDDCYLRHEWRDSFDDMRGEDWEAFLGDPCMEVHEARAENDDAISYPDATGVYLQKYILAQCGRGIVLSSDVADKIMIHVYCKSCDRHEKAIFWKASNAFPENEFDAKSA